MGPLGLDPVRRWARSEKRDPTISAVYGKGLLVRWWVQQLVKVGSSSLGEVMVASLLYHKGRTARWFTAQQASGTICVALAPTRGQTPANLVADPFRPWLRKVAAARSTSRGLRGETSSGRWVLVSSDPLEQSNGALAIMSPRKAEPRSCTVLGLKPMEKLITLDKYLSVRLNQGLAQSYGKTNNS